MAGECMPDVVVLILAIIGGVVVAGLFLWLLTSIIIGLMFALD